MTQHHPDPVVMFFSTSGRAFEPRMLSLGLDQGHAHNGGARNLRIAELAAYVEAASEFAKDVPGPE